MGMIQFPKDPFSQEVIAKLEREGLTIKWRYGYKLANRYEVKRVCAGGMGIVWIVEDLFDNRKPYAAKSIKPYFRKPTSDEEWKRREESIQRFLEECKIWVDLEKHRHIVYAEFLEKIEGVPLVMSEFIEGGDLSEWIKKGPLPLETLLDFAIQFCIGMEYANAKGVIVHRDIKPGNIMVSEDRIIKITDFGLVRAIESAEAIKEEKIETSPPFDIVQMSISRGMGTPSYMAPEQFSKRLLEYCDYPIIPIGIPTDVFAFGLVLYEMIKGVHPYIEKWDQKLWEKACKMAPNFSRDPRYVNYVYCFLKSSNLNLSIPISDNEALDELTLKCLKKYPNDRYQSFTGIKEELLRIYRQIEGRDYEIVEEPPQKPNLKNKAKTFWILGREEEALKLYDKALEEDPGDITTWQEKGFALAEAGRLKEFGICMEIIPYLKPSKSVIKERHENRILNAEFSTRDIRLLDDISLEYPDALKVKNYVYIKDQNEFFKDFNPDLTKYLNKLKDEDAKIRSYAAWKLGEIRDSTAIPALLEALKDKDWAVRENAERALGNIGDSIAIPALLEALKDEDRGVRYGAAKTLEDIGDSIAIPALFEALKDEYLAVRQVAARALVKIGDTTDILELLEVLKDQDRLVCEAAAEALENIMNSNAIPALLEALKHNNLTVCEAAAKALGNIGDPTAIHGLLQVFKDEHSFVRWYAAKTIRNTIGNSPAISGLIDALKDEIGWLAARLLKDKNWAVRAGAALILGDIGDSTAIPALIKALKDENWRVREAAVKALGKIKNPFALPSLLEALKDEDWLVRWNAAKALGKIGNSSAIPALLEALKDEYWEVREAAVKALGKIKNPFALPSLLEALKDKDRRVRRAAALALGKIGDSTVIPGLIEALKDKDWEVRENAVKALGKIADSSTIPRLLEILKDEDWKVRWAAVKALRKIWLEIKKEKTKLLKLKQSLSNYSALAWNQKGLEFLEADKYKEAQNCFEKAIELDPDWEEPRKNEEKYLKKIGKSKSKS